MTILFSLFPCHCRCSYLSSYFTLISTFFGGEFIKEEKNKMKLTNNQTGFLCHCFCLFRLLPSDILSMCGFLAIQSISLLPFDVSSLRFALPLFRCRIRVFRLYAYNSRIYVCFKIIYSVFFVRKTTRNKTEIIFVPLCLGLSQLNVEYVYASYNKHIHTCSYVYTHMHSIIGLLNDGPNEKK